MKLVTCSHQSAANQANFLREFLFVVEVISVAQWFMKSLEPCLTCLLNFCVQPLGGHINELSSGHVLELLTVSSLLIAKLLTD